MRILLVNHGSAGEWDGGDGVQIRETAKRLAQRGHQVMSRERRSTGRRGFDLAHLFNCRVEGSFINKWPAAKWRVFLLWYHRSGFLPRPMGQ